MADRVAALSDGSKKRKHAPSPLSGLLQYDGSSDDPTESAASQQGQENVPSPEPAYAAPEGRPTGIPAEVARSPQFIDGVGMLPPTTVAQAPTLPSGNAALIGIPRRQGLNPAAPLFDGSRAMLNHGPGVQPEAQDPMQEPPEHDVGVPAATSVQEERRVQAAVRHLAMAYRYLSAADRDGVANRYDGMFEQDFGERYTDERLRAIRDEPDDPPSESEQGDDGLEEGEEDL
ncbi:hypothetical protein LTR36_008498 [Oleoguttula mirabilis]|uniref:Uncharacterized protein n=1 Tax=Oleoguttula mirabilis TaxID=1507867 RepID=A0AAV9JT73_9PEZI|nr:hypothetical protein LTR36_008498 [Oleoguttula mirabilis]